MACCAAAIFILCQIAFGLDRLVALASGGRWHLLARSNGADAVTSWRLAGNGAGTAPPLPAQGWRRVFSNRLALNGSIAAVCGAILLASFYLTKPGVPSPLPQSEVIAMLHAKVCGDVSLVKAPNG